MSNNKETAAEKIRKASLEYLDSKYEDKFIAKSFSSGEWAYEYSSVIFSSEKYPDSSVEVRVYEADDGALVFRDNYYQCFMMKDAVDYFKEFVGEVKSSVKVRFSNTVWSDELNDVRTFSEWVNQGGCKLDIFVITERSTSESKRSVFVNTLVEQKISGTVCFLTTNDDSLLERKTIDEIMNNQRDYVVTKDDYYINSDFEIESN